MVSHRKQSKRKSASATQSKESPPSSTQSNGKGAGNKKWTTIPSLRCWAKRDVRLLERSECQSSVFTYSKKPDRIKKEMGHVDSRRDFDATETDMLRHYMECWKPRSSANTAPSSLIVLEAQDLNFCGAFRLLLGFKEDATLRDLDEALRAIWFEPCSCREPEPGYHFSKICFMHKERFASSLTSEISELSPDDPVVYHYAWKDRDKGESCEYQMDSQLADLLEEPGTQKKQQILYQFDLGPRATKIAVVCRGVKEVNFTLREEKAWHLLVRNEQLSVPCYASLEESKRPCSSDEAKYLLRDCSWIYDKVQSNSDPNAFAPERFYCSEECAARFGYEAPDLIPVANSPRMGSCEFGSITEHINID